MGFLKKRGETRTLYTVIALILGLFSGVFLVSEAKAWIDGYATNEVYLANDIALTIETLHALSGDVIYDYTEFTANHKISIVNGMIKVSEPTSQAEAQRSYISTTYSPIIKNFVKPEIISFRKTGNKIEVAEHKQYFTKEACPTITTEDDINKKIIYIDPGHYEKDKGLIGKYKEYKLTKKIADKIKALCGNCRIVEQKSLQEKEKQIFNPDLIISLQIGNQNEVIAFSQEKNNLYAMRSEKFACLIANKFSNIIQNTRTQSENFPDEYTRKMLDKQAVSVVVQIGNINNKEMFDQEEDFRQIAMAVYDAMKDYYKPSLETLPSETDVLVKNGAAAYT